MKAARAGIMIMAAIGCLACAGCDAVGKKLQNAGAGLIGGVVIAVIILMVVAWLGDDTPSDEELHDSKRKQEGEHWSDSQETEGDDW